MQPRGDCIDTPFLLVSKSPNEAMQSNRWPAYCPALPHEDSCCVFHRRSAIAAKSHLQTEFESVVSDVHAGGKPGFGRLRKVVADMGEVSRLRLYERGDFQRLAYDQ